MTKICLSNYYNMDKFYNSAKILTLKPMVGFS